MTEQQINNENNLVATKVPWQFLGVHCREILVGTVSLAVLFHGARLVAAEPPMGGAPIGAGVTEPAQSQRRESISDLERRASDFGQRMRDRYLKVPTTSAAPATTQDPAPQATSTTSTLRITTARPPVLTSEPTPTPVANSSAAQPVAGWVRLSPLRYPVPNTTTTPTAPKQAAATNSATPHPAATVPNVAVTSETAMKPVARAIPRQAPTFAGLEKSETDALPILSPLPSTVGVERAEHSDSELVESTRTVQASGHIKESPSPHESFAKFQTMLRRKFPRSDIQLQWTRGSLVVSGTVADRQEAIQIMAFVRETYLVPVIDRLEVPRGKPGKN